MFEQEIELEEKEGSGLGPIVVVLILVGLLVGGIGYFVFQTRQMLKAEDATPVIVASLNARGPALLKFRSGRVDDHPDGPHYKLLADAGLIKITPIKQSVDIDVVLTPEGENLVTTIPKVEKLAKENATEYVVPLAGREFVGVSKITKLAPGRFQVDYTWKWIPTQLGEMFDVNSQYMKKFGTYDRTVLIDRYGADFYKGDPNKSTITIVKGPNGWATE